MIEGTVSTPAWVAPLGLTIAFDDQLDEIQATVNDQGRFRFDDVAPGAYSLELQGRRGELSSPPSVVVQVAAGETTRVTLAAEEYGECRVRVHVTGSGAEVLERSSVWPQWVEPGLWPSFFESLGQLDETARVAGSLLAQGKVTFRLHTPGGTSLHFATPVVDLESATEHDVELVLPLGAVSLTLPVGLPVPEHARISIDATAPGETEPAWSHGSRLPSGSVLDIPQCLAGRWTLAVKLTSKSTPSPEVQLPDGGQSVTRPALYEAQLEVQVPEGGRASVTLP